MQKKLQGMARVLAMMIAVATVAGLVAVAKRFHAEMRNRRVEIGIEYAELDALAQTTGQPLPDILERMKADHMTAVILAEDTLVTLEQTGAIHLGRIALPGGDNRSTVEVYNYATLERIRQALALRGMRSHAATLESVPHTDSTTVFYCPGPATVGGAPAVHNQAQQFLAVDVDYAHLRTLGVGLPPSAVQTVQDAQLAIVGRIANFPGVTAASARKVLESLKAQGASLVIFNGDDVLGYRGLEKEVAGMLREPGSKPLLRDDPAQDLPPTGLIYGAVEFSKQRGDELLSTTLHGDYVRVHSIQSAELATLDENEVIDRFVRAARERNIRLCYIRLFTTAGADAVDQNVEMLHKISRGIEHGSELTGGGFEFGTAKRFDELNVPVLLYGLMGLGVAAGVLWMLRELCPLRSEGALLLALVVVCVGLTLVGETGRRLAALLAGIAFPAVACLRAFPRSDSHIGVAVEALPQPPGVCITRSIRAIVLASGITALGIVTVAGLLASRPFMLRTSQFLGIKAQHAVPILIVAFAALVGGVRLPHETWKRYYNRATTHLQRAMNEPARFGVLLLGIVALAALLLIVARTGNDAGVGVSGAELKARALMDRIFPVRPRTKEALVGHPALILALAWWWRGRRRLALPCFVVGSIGQVSLLNTFCHIHTPLIISLWHGGLGIVIGIFLGSLLFLALEKVLPSPNAEQDTE